MVVAEHGVVAWGGNEAGQCGQGDSSPSILFRPRLVAGLQGVVVAAVCCGAAHTLALTKSGKVFGWGDNKEGQLGLGDLKSRSLPSPLEALGDVRVTK